MSDVGAVDGAWEIFAAATPGMEPAVAAELEALAERPVETVPGGVVLAGDLEDAAGLSLWARTPARILVRLGRIQARSPQQLGAESRRLPWAQVLQPGQQIQARATIRRGCFKRADAAVAKVEQAAREATRGRRAPSQRPPPPQEVSIRIEGPEATISLDAGGGLLHLRGYREQTAKAPIRENLAASALIAAGWIPGVPLLDPMCGAGTFSIEAAWMARDRAPGLDRIPPVTAWPGFPPGAWEAMCADARRAIRPAEGLILASDRDGGAVRAARANARRADAEAAIQIAHAPIESLERPPGQPGLVILNPPYGVRVAGDQQLAGLYRRWGSTLRERLEGWRLAVICPDRALAGRLLPRIEEVLRFKNGGISVGLFIGDL